MVEHLHPTCYHLNETQRVPFLDIGFRAHQYAHCHHNTLHVNRIQSTITEDKRKEVLKEKKSLRGKN